MSASQRRKGANGENELAKILTEELGWIVKRELGQARDGGHDMQVGRFKIEVKRRKAIAVYDFMEQIQKVCSEQETPVVVMRADGKKWLVMLTLEDFIPIMREALPPR